MDLLFRSLAQIISFTLGFSLRSIDKQIGSASFGYIHISMNLFHALPAPLDVEGIVHAEMNICHQTFMLWKKCIIFLVFSVEYKKRCTSSQLKKQKRVPLSSMHTLLLKLHLFYNLIIWPQMSLTCETLLGRLFWGLWCCLWLFMLLNCMNTMNNANNRSWEREPNTRHSANNEIPATFTLTNTKGFSHCLESNNHFQGAGMLNWNADETATKQHVYFPQCTRA